ncbi:hypothetical protein V2J09_003494 [Rumex salicifolius]
MTLHCIASTPPLLFPVHLLLLLLQRFFFMFVFLLHFSLPPLFAVTVPYPSVHQEVAQFKICISFSIIHITTHYILA